MSSNTREKLRRMFRQELLETWIESDERRFEWPMDIYHRCFSRGMIEDAQDNGNREIECDVLIEEDRRVFLVEIIHIIDEEVCSMAKNVE